MKHGFKFLLITAGLALAACSHKPHNAASNETAGWGPEVPYRAPAAECQASGSYKECKNAPREAWASQFMLSENGDLWAYRAEGNKKCQITNNVKSKDDFKVSMHLNDGASLYYEREGDLFALIFRGDRNTKDCPSQDKQKLMENVKKWTVTSNTNTNTNTTIVNSALDKSGNFSAWDNRAVVYSDTRIQEFMMNNCFGKSGKSFSSYVLFTLDQDGYVTRVKMNDTLSGIYNASKSTNQQYNSIADFKERENVCQ